MVDLLLRVGIQVNLALASFNLVFGCAALHNHQLGIADAAFKFFILAVLSAGLLIFSRKAKINQNK